MKHYDNTYVKDLENHIANIKIGGNDGVLHLKNIFSDGQIESAVLLLSEIHFMPLEHEGRVARFEAIDINSFNPVVSQIHDLLWHTRAELKLDDEYSVESYAFKYEVGHYVPEHKDRERHKVTAIAYFGDFEGGEVVYKKYGCEDEFRVKPKEGDLVLSVNETDDGRVLNPIHCVEEIRSGTRLCLVASLVSKNG